MEMGDLINRKALLEKAKDAHFFEEIYHNKLGTDVGKTQLELDELGKTKKAVSVEDILKAPLVNAEPVRHGRWRHLGGDEWRCTICGEVIHTEDRWERPSDKYCRECGARMDGEARKQWKLNGSNSRTDCRKSGKR